MPSLSWPEIRNRATAFAREWRDEKSERAEAQTFWNEFFEIFGVKRRRVAVYEKQVDKLPRKGKTAHGRIDVFWPGTLLAEHKSEGEDLDAAYTQALDYFAGLKDDELPRWVVVSDFRRFRLYDLEEHSEIEFALKDLPSRISAFGFIAGYNAVKLRDEPEANLRAVQKLGELHDALKADGYGLDVTGHAGHPLQVFLVRVLFCLFADDTGLFSPKDSFLELIEHTREDGGNTGGTLARLFQALNTPLPQRQHSVAETYAAFPYVNGRLFEESLPIPEFNAPMRELLIACCRLQWAGISPAIFGAMFQKIIELDAKDRRRQLGAHYTSEANILKLIGPLFLDELRAEFERVKRNKSELFEFHKKLRTLTFLDPACGCGNFLVITYRELRRLELDVLKAAQAFGQAIAGVFKDAVQVNVDQFYGIEIEEFPAQVAQVAMWLTDHQMNLEAGREFAEYFNRLPLNKSAHIRHGDALRLDWEEFAPPTRLNYILGNPPFVGKQYQTDEQKASFDVVAGKLKGAGVLDFVAGWYLKAAQYLAGGKEASITPGKKQFRDTRFGTSSPSLAQRGRAGVGDIEDIFVALENAADAARSRIRCAFVSTNSITQGEQVGVLWSELFRRGLHIQFAHRTFKWSNEAPGKAAVHCVIVGFGLEDFPKKRLFEYADIDGPAHEVSAKNINPYLVDAPDVAITNRRKPIADVAELNYGSFALDDGNFTLSPKDREEILAEDPSAEKFMRRFIGGRELLHSEDRWCLWLQDASPAEIHKCLPVKRRVEAVRKWREASGRATTRGLASTPTLFAEVRQPDTNYLAMPTLSSEKRRFIPAALLTPDVIASNQVYVLPNAKLFHFGVMSSTMHMAWVRNVCGRFKSDFRYSAQIVYNNFPWPESVLEPLSHRERGRGEGSEKSQPVGDTEPSSGASRHLLPRGEGKEQRAAIEAAAQAVLDARAAHAGATLAQLYDPNTMPPDLARAHAALDRAVDAAYRADGGAKTYANDAERVAFLFRRYAQLTSLV